MPKSRPGEADETAWATAMLDVGISIGTLFIIPAVTFLVEAVGWRHTYHIVGCVSGIFVAIWALLAAASPSECWFIGAEEQTFLEENVPQRRCKAGASSAEEGALKAPRFERIFGIPVAIAFHPGVWAVFFAHMAFNFGAYYLTNWSPTYYKEVIGMSGKEATAHLMAPHVANLAAKAMNPYLSGLLARNGCSLLACRRAFTCSGFLLASATLLLVYSLRTSPMASTVAFSMANAFFGLAPNGFKANYLDITEQYVGIISGYGNTLGTVASAVQPRLLAFMLDQFKSWPLVLVAVAAINALAAVIYFAYSTVTPVEKLLLVNEGSVLKRNGLVELQRPLLEANGPGAGGGEATGPVSRAKASRAKAD
jgi:ACS family sodium-dependent inorganic phosphate cotransporter